MIFKIHMSHFSRSRGRKQGMSVPWMCIKERIVKKFRTMERPKKFYHKICDYMWMGYPNIISIQSFTV